MVYLKEEIKRLKDELIEDNNSIDIYFYNYIKGIKNKLNNEEEIDSPRILAMKGYSNLNEEESVINKIIDRPALKGLSYKNNIYELLGIYLLCKNNTKILQDIEEKYNLSDIKNKFIISKIIPSYKARLEAELKIKVNCSEIEEIIKYILCAEFYKINTDIYYSYIEKSNDIVDLIILEDLLQKRIIADICHDDSPRDVIVGILNEFSNACKKITRDRREKHECFKINDEYDVQDLLYVIFKSYYPSIIPEENAARIAGKADRADFFFREFKIVLEIKMIKEKDTNEKKFIPQIKEDIESYYSLEPEYMIFYIYDPFGKTTDENNFTELNGKRMNTWNDKEIKYDVLVIRGGN